MTNTVAKKLPSLQKGQAVMVQRGKKLEPAKVFYKHH